MGITPLSVNPVQTPETPSLKREWFKIVVVLLLLIIAVPNLGYFYISLIFGGITTSLWFLGTSVLAILYIYSLLKKPLLLRRLFIVQILIVLVSPLAVTGDLSASSVAWSQIGFLIVSAVLWIYAKKRLTQVNLQRWIFLGLLLVSIISAVIILVLDFEFDSPGFTRGTSPWGNVSVDIVQVNDFQRFPQKTLYSLAIITESTYESCNLPLKGYEKHWLKDGELYVKLLRVMRSAVCLEGISSSHQLKIYHLDIDLPDLTSQPLTVHLKQGKDMATLQLSADAKYLKMKVIDGAEFVRVQRDKIPLIPTYITKIVYDKHYYAGLDELVGNPGEDESRKRVLMPSHDTGFYSIPPPEELRIDSYKSNNRGNEYYDYGMYYVTIPSVDLVGPNPYLPETKATLEEYMIGYTYLKPKELFVELAKVLPNSTLRRIRILQFGIDGKVNEYQAPSDLPSTVGILIDRLELIYKKEKERILVDFPIRLPRETDLHKYGSVYANGLQRQDDRTTYNMVVGTAPDCTNGGACYIFEVSATSDKDYRVDSPLPGGNTIQLNREVAGYACYASEEACHTPGSSNIYFEYLDINYRLEIVPKYDKDLVALANSLINNDPLVYE